MKTLFSFGMAAFVLGFIFSADLAAGEKETEKMLIKQGWVSLSVEELKALMDFTASSYISTLYVDPTGRKYVYQHSDSGMVNRGKRRVTTAGKVCFTPITANAADRDPPIVGPKGELWRCRSVWKRGKEYLDLKPDGTYSSEYEIKPGNPENL